MAQAHTAGLNLHGWSDGFAHPLHGWDHLLAMFAVGLWAAQQRGRALWLLPLVLVGAMSLGGVAGALGAELPGAEWVVLASVAVFGLFVARRQQFRPGVSALVAAFFAFFHGFAHGQEMPGSASLVSFGAGFALATLLLCGLGVVTARLAFLAAACVLGGNAVAQETTSTPPGTAGPRPPGEGTSRLPEVVVRERSDSLLGVADSASHGTVGPEQLDRRPLLRPGEVLETVPGVIVTQHSGSGKANQYFLRGFNLDHGTDFATSVDGVPVNLPTHGHGQGYTDLNFLIPELVSGIAYRKGPYHADTGDFSSAGAADIATFGRLPHSLFVLEGGSWDYARGVYASSPRVGPGHLLHAVELFHADGPWDNPDDFRKLNGVLRYGVGDDANGWSVTAMAYAGKWNATDQIARSAVDTGLIGRFGSINVTGGGESQRHSLAVEWHRADERSATEVLAYGFYYDLNLFSDFTYFLASPAGDQFEQADRRRVGGGKAAHTWFSEWQARQLQTTAGLQVRSDSIRNGLFQTVGRVRTDKPDHAAGVIPAVTRADEVWQVSVSPYVENRIQWTDKFRSVAGLRADYHHFDVDSTLAANSGTEDDVLVSPRGSLIFGPWAKTEIYVSGGLGFHSNDGRGATTTVDPSTGMPVDPVDPLVRTCGAEIGARTTWLPGLQSTVSFWWLDIESELLFVGDAGTTEASRPSRRYGVEFANYYTPLPWLTFDADLAVSHARFRDEAIDPMTMQPVGDRIPGAIETVVSAGVSVRDRSGLFGELRARYFGPRPLVEDNSVRSGSTTLFNGRIGCRLNEKWTLAVEVFNIFDTEASDIEYFYESRVTPMAVAMEEIHFHPVEPRSIRLSLSGRF